MEDAAETPDAFLDEVAACMRGAFSGLRMAETFGEEWGLAEALSPGKMLRARLGWALAAGTHGDRDQVVAAGAATELIHAASLFHDDVIDGASMRRSQPALWRRVGATGAILVGDLFVSAAVGMLVVRAPGLISSFVPKVRELCEVEVLHEIVLRGRALSPEQALRVARGKTGPLFAFVAGSATPEGARREAFEEIGYLIGTAYQLADDILDEVGCEQATGKTLGTDRKRAKYTLAQDQFMSAAELRGQVGLLCDRARALAGQWPGVGDALERYLQRELLPRWPSG